MDLGELIGSLSKEDLNGLRSAAQQLFSEEEKAPAQPAEPAGFADMKTFEKLASLSSALRQRDKRTEFLTALRPMLSEPRQKKTDEAIRLLQLMKALETLGASGLLTGGAAQGSSGDG